MDERLRATFIVDLLPAYTRMHHRIQEIVHTQQGQHPIWLEHPFFRGLEAIVRGIWLGAIDQIADEYLHIRSLAGERHVYHELVQCSTLRMELLELVFVDVYRELHPVSTMAYEHHHVPDVSFYDTFDGNVAVCWRK